MHSNSGNHEKAHYLHCQSEIKFQTTARVHAIKAPRHPSLPLQHPRDIIRQASSRARRYYGARILTRTRPYITESLIQTARPPRNSAFARCAQGSFSLLAMRERKGTDASCRSAHGSNWKKKETRLLPRLSLENRSTLWILLLYMSLPCTFIFEPGVRCAVVSRA